MNSSLVSLASLINKPRIIVGLMSGTSLDGLDIALCEVCGHDTSTELKIKHFICVPYNEEFLNKVRPLFANPLAPLHEVTKANAWIAREHARMVLASLAKWDIKAANVNILASHGQTIFHAPNILPAEVNSEGTVPPKASATLQIGDGCHLAHITQILTLSDFRQKHVAANGEGAPLVPYADFLLFASANENRILLNIGGIANYTYLPANQSFSAVVSADIGPGNTLMDMAISYAEQLSLAKNSLTSLPRINQLYDMNGEFAAKGIVNQRLLTTLMAQASAVDKPYADQNISTNKSTGQETYNLNFIHKALEKNQSSSLRSFPTTHKAFYDLLATLTMFTAKSIGNAINELISTSDKNYPSTLYISGGGVHNPVLLKNIQYCTPNITLKISTELGIHPDAKEAALFAVLANQTVFGSSQIFSNNNGVPATCLGKISLP
ncbi:MAG: anhydro-N-acetylmuramic acid kinase [Yoonia sp.]|jgi:anhydro-N-acetylmuramic acid kinase